MDIPNVIIYFTIIFIKERAGLLHKKIISLLNSRTVKQQCHQHQHS